MPILYLIRHGQTVFNLEHRLQGSEIDSPLTPLGEEQARSCGLILRNLLNGRPAPRFVSSPQGRALATTRLILRTLGLPEDAFATDADLREIGIGRAAGLTMAELESRFPEDLPLIQRDRAIDAVPVGGESDAALSSRVARWFASVDSDTVAVSHRTFGRFLRAHVLGLDRAGLAALDEPQDCVFKIEAGRVTRAIARS